MKAINLISDCADRELCSSRWRGTIFVSRSGSFCRFWLRFGLWSPNRFYKSDQFSDVDQIKMVWIRWVFELWSKGRARTGAKWREDVKSKRVGLHKTSVVRTRFGYFKVNTFFSFFRFFHTYKKSSIDWVCMIFGLIGFVEFLPFEWSSRIQSNWIWLPMLFVNLKKSFSFQ